MTTNSAVQSGNGHARLSARQSDEGRRIIHQLNEMALNGLPQMFNAEKQLFCHKLKKVPSGVAQEGLSPRYTMMTLMGFHRVEQNGGTAPLASKPIFEHLLSDTSWITNVGDLGLLVWTCALLDPARLPELSRQLDVKNAMARYGNSKQNCTVHLSWLLGGLSHATLANSECGPGFQPLAAETYGRLLRNQGEEGFFGSYGKNASLVGFIRGEIGSFADQVYPIYSFTRYAQAFGDSKATERALDCALAICEVQGSLGQWWWHYNATSGRVINGFPVFSVHQHGMAPMALLALGEAIQSDFSPWIHKGISWISNNELAYEMRDFDINVIWRCIERSEAHKYWNAMMEAITQRDHRESRHNLKVLYECRPYELGWLLYAFAPKDDQLSSIQVGKPLEAAVASR
jgi:hypothetical protein